LIYISESNNGKSGVTVRVEGSLKSESLPVFEEVYTKHIEAEKQVAVDLDGIMGVDRTAKAFLKKIKHSVEFIDMPAYLELEIGISTRSF